MSPDVKLKDYYLKFINEAKDNIRENTKLKKDCISIKCNLKNFKIASNSASTIIVGVYKDILP